MMELRSLETPVIASAPDEFIFAVAPPVIPGGITAEDHALLFTLATILPVVVVVPLGEVEAEQLANMRAETIRERNKEP